MRRLTLSALGVIATGLACHEGSRPMPFTLPPVNEVPYAVSFSSHPHDARAGDTLRPFQVAIVGISGHLVTTASSRIVIGLVRDGCNGGLHGTYSVQAVNGVAWFSDVFLDRPCAIVRINSTDTFGGYRVVANASGLRADTSRRFGIVDGPARHVMFATHTLGGRAEQPVGRVLTVGGQPTFDPRVVVRTVDIAGLPKAWYGPITISLAANPANATLTGETVISTADAWIAELVFSNLRISKAGDGYTLVVSAPGLRPDTSAPFTIQP